MNEKEITKIPLYGSGNYNLVHIKNILRVAIDFILVSNDSLTHLSNDFCGMQSSLLREAFFIRFHIILMFHNVLTLMFSYKYQALFYTAYRFNRKEQNFIKLLIIYFTTYL